jgi:hypothetical protein
MAKGWQPVGALDQSHRKDQETAADACNRRGF